MYAMPAERLVHAMPAEQLLIACWTVMGLPST